ncbi:MAG: hypothetical protein FJZ60_03695 [Chlamydiae bacterium]|nr:hypothetical protein [Chlamydiota bacterium]
MAKELVKFMEKHIGKPEESISKPRLWENIKTLMAEKFKIDLLSLANIKKSQDIPTLLEERFEEFQGIAKKLYERHTDANTYSDLQRAMQKMMVKDSDSSRTKET